MDWELRFPKSVYPIIEATLYRATAPKCNRDAAGLGHGQGYVYPHERPGPHAGQQYLPTAVLDTYFYSPSEEGYKASVKDRLARWPAGARRRRRPSA